MLFMSILQNTALLSGDRVYPLMNQFDAQLRAFHLLRPLYSIRCRPQTV